MHFYRDEAVFPSSYGSYAMADLYPRIQKAHQTEFLCLLPRLAHMLRYQIDRFYMMRLQKRNTDRCKMWDFLKQSTPNLDIPYIRYSREFQREYRSERHRRSRRLICNWEQLIITQGNWSVGNRSSQITCNVDPTGLEEAIVVNVGWAFRFPCNLQSATCILLRVSTLIFVDRQFDQSSHANNAKLGYYYQ